MNEKITKIYSLTQNDRVKLARVLEHTAENLFNRGNNEGAFKLLMKASELREGKRNDVNR